MDRPSDLPFRTKDGLYATWLPNDKNFEQFVKTGIRWSTAARDGAPKKTPPGKYGYAIFDSFFADFISSSAVSEILSLCTPDEPLRVLLANPNSSFALARAEAMEVGSSSGRALAGLDRIIEAVRDWVFKHHNADRRPNLEADNEYFSSVAFLEHLIEKNDVPLEIRFYSIVPSGPRLFLKDLLISGTFCTDRSSLRFPWSLIADNPDTQLDMFDAFSEEFERVWNLESTHSDPRDQASLESRLVKGGHRYFLSYHRDSGKELADHVEVLLRREMREVLRDDTGVFAGRPIDYSVDTLIQECDTFVAIWSRGYMASNYCQGEYATVSGLDGKRICFLKTADDLQVADLPMTQRANLFLDAHARNARELAISDLIGQEMSDSSEDVVRHSV